ncbi:MAG: hypothetical protein HYT46_01285 [Candidatus Vogelbacteria bacterium]|nr:hypothetical protein [Candidatus Vogelbacteria bacterium]
MSTITLPKFEYRELKKKASAYEAMTRLPHYYLKGKSARKLDRRVEQSLKEYLAGKTRKIKSVADLM